MCDGGFSVLCRASTQIRINRFCKLFAAPEESTRGTLRGFGVLKWQMRLF